MVSNGQIARHKIIRNILINSATAHDDIKEVHNKVEIIRSSTHMNDISAWLSPPDPSINHSNALNIRHLGTGKWFLGHPAYSNWKSNHASFLWLHGIPGCGKTILSSTIIEDLSSRYPLYFYFDFSDTRKQNFDMMLRSLIIQLYRNHEGARSYLDSLYSSSRRGGQQPP